MAACDHFRPFSAEANITDEMLAELVWREGCVHQRACGAIALRPTRNLVHAFGIPFPDSAHPHAVAVDTFTDLDAGGRQCRLKCRAVLIRDAV